MGAREGIDLPLSLSNCRIRPVYCHTVKSFAAIAATALLAALIFGANFGWWLDRSVIDSDSFVESAVSSLGEESSRVAIGHLIVDEMVDEVPLLIIVESNLVALFSDLLSTGAFGELIRFVAVDVHERVVTGDADAVAISLVDYRDLILGPVVAIAPVVEDLVPESWFVSVEILEAGALPDLSAYAAWIGIVKVLATVGALAIAAGMLWLSQRTGDAVVRIGIASCAAGAATFALVPGARWLTLVDIDRLPVRVVIGNTFDAFTGQLMWSASIMIVLGIVLIVLGATVRPDGSSRRLRSQHR